METQNQKYFSLIRTGIPRSTRVFQKIGIKKDAYLSISVKRTVEFQKMITQMNFCFDFLLLYLRRRDIIQKKTLNTMCYRLLEVGHWTIKIL